MATVSAVNTPGKLARFASTAWMMDDSANVDVTVVSGRTETVHLDTEQQLAASGPTAPVSGTVMIDGTPGRGTSIVAWTDGRRRVAQVDASGRFDLGQVAAGHVNLNLFDTGSEGGIADYRSLWSRSVQVEADKPLDITVAIDTASVTGFVVGVDGAPAAGAEVTLQGTLTAPDGKPENAGNTWRRATTDQNGRFELDKLAAGTYSAEAEQNGKGKGRAASFKLEGGIGQSVEIRLAQVVTVRGRVDLSVFGAQRPEWIWVEFQCQEGDRSTSTSWAGVDDDGSFEADDLAAGEYEVWVHAQTPNSEGRRMRHDGKLLVQGQSIDGVVLRPVAPPPEKPREQGR
jgi:hypothetical protein